MKYSYSLLTLPLVLLTALGSATLGAQVEARVIFSEINLRPADPGDTRWIELHNSGDLEADLTGWGIYHVSKTQGLPGVHWWAFPDATALPARGFLRVHWYADYQAPTSTDFYTGTHPLRFLFSLGGEELSENQGGLALLSDTSAKGTNLASSYEDWISWGEDGYVREELAVSNGRWVAGDYVDPLHSEGSIALDLARKGPLGQPTRASAFFHDASPTPLDFNHRDARVSEPIGWSCAIGSVNSPSLELLSVPTAGNMDFAVRVSSNAVGFGTQIVLLLVTPNQGTGASIPGVFECPLWIDLAVTPRIFIRIAEGGDTDFTLPLTLATGGFEVTMQAVQIRDPFSVFDHASSQGLSILLGY